MMSRKHLLTNPETGEHYFVKFNTQKQAEHYCDLEGLIYSGMELFYLKHPLTQEDGKRIAKRVNKNFMSIQDKIELLCSSLDDESMDKFFDILDDIFHND